MTYSEGASPRRRVQHAVTALVSKVCPKIADTKKGARLLWLPRDSQIADTKKGSQIALAPSVLLLSWLFLSWLFLIFKRGTQSIECCECLIVVTLDQVDCLQQHLV
jgi:hypothetical protein